MLEHESSFVPKKQGVLKDLLSHAGMKGDADRDLIAT
jgi:hypothetical protein